MKRTSALLCIVAGISCSGCGSDHGANLVDGGGVDAPISAPDTSIVGGSFDALSSDGLPSTFTLEELMDPTTCQPCHPSQYEQWAGSMHAYAAEDPVFHALNRRGQREANLGDFCVHCHAPLAELFRLTKDGSNLADLPKRYRGVTCYFCHAVADVAGTHDNPLTIANDGIMRGQFSDAMPTTAHGSAYSSWLDRDQANSSTMCGSCHDIKTGAGTIERTFAEWQSSVFAQAPGGATCSQCHMDQGTSLAAGASVPDAPLRRLHDHGYPAVDTALTPGFPETAAHKNQIQALMDSTLQSALCVQGQGSRATIMVVLDNVAAGHSWPSGAALVRRSWVEVKAYSGGQVFYQSGVPSPGQSIATLKDPDLWLMRDCMLDDNNNEVMAWSATKFESSVLPYQLTFIRTDLNFYKSHVYAVYPRAVASSGFSGDGGASAEPDGADGASTDAQPLVAGLGQMPERVELRIKLEAMGLDFIDSLIASGDLDPSYRAQIPIFTLGGDPALEWTPAAATEVFLDGHGQPVSCISKTNLKAQADKVPAARLQHCQP